MCMNSLFHQFGKQPKGTQPFGHRYSGNQTIGNKPGQTGKQSGFTLVEIAVVLVIVGVLIGSFINTFTNRIDNSRISDTEAELQLVKQGLMAYAYGRPVATAYLPCPDTNGDGDENRLGANCNADSGRLPWRTLGMAQADAWGNQYLYWVNPNYSVDTGFDLTTGNAGNASVTTRINNVNQAVATNAVAIIFSTGKNGFGGVSSEGVNQPAIPGAGYDDENENQDGDVTFVSRFRTEQGVAAAGGVFDDILVWISMYELKAKMVEAGKLP